MLLFLTGLFIIFGAACSPATTTFVPPSGGSSGVDPVVLLTEAPPFLPPTRTLPPTGPVSASASPAAAKTTPAPVGSAAQIGATATRPAPTSQATTNPLLTLDADSWQKLPIIPLVSERMLEIYQLGQELGNNPHAFSKIGDCGSTPAWFLGDFDRGPSYYRLGKYQYLEAVIQQFHGSFDRTSLAARAGFNASALFVPIWADRNSCGADESPLVCEYRVNRPVIAFIMLGTNDVYHPEEFEPQMRKIIEYSLAQGVIPILTTKADNKEGDGSINATIARLAQEYQVPLWNFYAAVDPLANNGLQEDMAHLSWGRNLFDDPEAMSKAWPQRNLTALQALDAVWQKIK